MYKIRTPHKSPNGKVFAWMALIAGFGVGMVNPIFPNFVKTFLKTDQEVSLFFSFIALATCLTSLLSPLIFSKIRRSTITFTAFLCLGLSLFFYILTTGIIGLNFLSVMRFFFEMLIWIALGLFVRDFTKESDLGRQEGLYYKYQNTGFLLGPLLGGFLAMKFGYELVFITAAAVIFSALSYFLHLNFVKKHPTIVANHSKKGHKIFGSIRKFFQNKGRKNAFIITFAFMIWISFKRLYIPLYVINSGYLESVNGLIFALGIIPLILFEKKVGKYADKKGLKKPLKSGFLIIGLIMLIVFINPFPLLNFLLFILINIGKAFIEPLQETYLFKNLPESQEEDLYGVYMTADPLAYFITPTIGAIILFFLPFKVLFFAFALIFLSAALFIHKKL